MESLALTGAPAASFWRGKRVLLTGHSGFKGSWLTLWLSRLGAAVTGISLPPSTTPNLYSEANVGDVCRSRFCDIRDGAALTGLVNKARPEIVFHLAAQPLVRAGYREPSDTFATNVMGTVNLLEALRGLDGLQVAVMVTTDKVYREDSRRTPYREEDPLGGHDPYSASKAASEIVISSYRASFLSARGVSVATARAGNVIGGGDWSDERLIPDAVRAWQAGRVLNIRRPEAVRPWQHVLEPLNGYLILAQRLWEKPTLAGSYNFGPEAGGAASVRTLVDLARLAYGQGAVRYGDSQEGPHEAAWLALEVAKARQVLGMRPVLSLAEAVSDTMAWYLAHNDGVDARVLCQRDISVFEQRIPSSEPSCQT